MTCSRPSRHRTSQKEKKGGYCVLPSRKKTRLGKGGHPKGSKKKRLVIDDTPQFKREKKEKVQTTIAQATKRGRAIKESHPGKGKTGNLPRHPFRE